MPKPKNFQGVCTQLSEILYTCLYLNLKFPPFGGIFQWPNAIDFIPMPLRNQGYSEIKFCVGWKTKVHILYNYSRIEPNLYIPGVKQQLSLLSDCPS